MKILFHHTAAATLKRFDYLSLYNLKVLHMKNVTQKAQK